jgi:hypothetical protein
MLVLMRRRWRNITKGRSSTIWKVRNDHHNLDITHGNADDIHIATLTVAQTLAFALSTYVIDLFNDMNLSKYSQQ